MGVRFNPSLAKIAEVPTASFIRFPASSYKMNQVFIHV